MLDNDLDPKGRMVRQNFRARTMKLREDIEKVPLSAFHFGDLEALLTLAGAFPDRQLREVHLMQLETRIREYRTRVDEEFHERMRRGPF